MRTVTQTIITTDAVILETFNGLSAPGIRSECHRIMSGLLNRPTMQTLPLSRELLQQGQQLHLNRQDKDWSLTDCISFVVMNEQSITSALAYDHHFEQAGFDPLLRRKPAR